MRIIGGHDYYDSGLAYGQDDRLVFLRNGDRRATGAEMRDEFHLPRAILGASLGDKSEWRNEWHGETSWHRMHSVEVRSDGRAMRHDVKHAEVVLCGKLYRGLRIESYQPYGMRQDHGTRWFWKADALRAFAVEHGLELHEGDAGTERKWIGAGTEGPGRRQVEVPVLTLEQWFEPLQLEGRAMDALVTGRVTIAYRTPEGYPPRNARNEPLTWAIDQAGLREMEFAKAVDPYTAFQEISMWKGGVLPSDAPETVEITDDKVKIAKHGFHHPTSFRKAKAGA